jgi:hypothetical protein
MGPAGRPVKSHATRTFWYHSAFLPEYFTTVCITVLVNWAVNAYSPVDPIPIKDNPYVPSAWILHLWVVVFLLGLTAYYRWRYCTVSLSPDALTRSFPSAAGWAVAFSEIDRLTEHRGWFFGRRARVLEIGVWGGGSVRVTDFIHGYEDLKATLAEASGKPVEHEVAEEGALARLRLRATEREKVFGPAGPFDFLLRIPSRFICLLPVFLLDLIMTLRLVYGAFYQDFLAVFAGTIVLLVSALGARFIYYYLFSSVFLNWPGSGR